MTVIVSVIPSRLDRLPQQQQIAALNALDSLLRNVQIELNEVDETGNVKWLTISNSSHDELPRDFARYVSQVENILFWKCNFTHLPSFGAMARLRSLSFCYCRNLRGFPTEGTDAFNALALDECIQFDYASQLPQLQQLKEFKLVDEDYIEHLPLAIFSLSNLERILLTCWSVKRIPEEIGNLRNLEKLELYCQRVEFLPRTIGNLRKVEEFCLTSSKITELPVEMGQMVALKFLDLYGESTNGCPELKTIPVEVLRLSALEFIDLTGCYKVSIPVHDILKCTTTSLVGFHTDVLDSYGWETDCSETVERTHELLYYMSRLNEAGRRLLKQNASIPLALWCHVLGRCTHEADCLYFFLVQLDSLREVTRIAPSQVQQSAKRRRVKYS